MYNKIKNKLKKYFYFQYKSGYNINIKKKKSYNL